MQRIGSWAKVERPTLRRTARRWLGAVTGLDVSVRRIAPPAPPVPPRYAAALAAMAPAARARAVGLEYGLYDPQTRELFVTHDAGLHSCLSVTLWSLADLLGEGHVPLKINFAYTLDSYKDQPLEDTFTRLFLPIHEESRIRDLIRDDRLRLQRFDHHGDYGKYDFHTLSVLLEVYLRPSATLVERIRTLERSHIAADQRYVGVCFRGTDKVTEIIPVDSALYLALAERLLAEGRADRVFIQTDQEQVGSLFKRVFGPLCDSVERLPRTSGSVAIHLGDAIRGSRLDFALDMMAVVYSMAKMEQLIVYTGNIGAWIALLRGTGVGLWQATPAGLAPQWTSANVPAGPR